jgi:PTH1 family peptidyl-tRNA hydrolase
LWAVVGLGNPGLKYRKTRHNAGFFLVMRVAKKAGLRLKKKRFLAKVAEIQLAGQEVLLALPQTFMNRSGDSVRRITEETRIPPDRIIVIYDDLDLPLGDIRIRREGRAGSHRGMMSISAALETQLFPRVRIGIGPKPPEAEAADFVLSAFRAAERPRLDESLERAHEALLLIIGGDISAAMNVYNKRGSAADDGPCGQRCPAA